MQYLTQYRYLNIPNKWRINFMNRHVWLLWKWCFFVVGAPDIGNIHIWGFWGAYNVAWTSFLPWILFYFWLPVIPAFQPFKFSCSWNLNTRMCGQQTPLTPPGSGHGAERSSSISKKNLEQACVIDMDIRNHWPSTWHTWSAAYSPQWFHSCDLLIVNLTVILICGGKSFTHVWLGNCWLT